jgi:hypothetical protein
VVTAAPRNPLIADLSTLAVFGHALAGAVRASVLAIVAPLLMRRKRIRR